MQHKAAYLLYCKFTLHVSGVYHTRPMLKGGSCTKNMTSTGGSNYSFVYS